MGWSSTENKEIRKFGFVALIFFGCLCGLGIWKHKVVPIYLFGFLSALGLGFILIPKTLSPLYSGWLKIAHFVGRIITTLVLALAYYLVLTPTALIKRLFTGAPLPLKPDGEVATYWVTRTEPTQPKERFLRRF